MRASLLTSITSGAAIASGRPARTSGMPPDGAARPPRPPWRRRSWCTVSVVMIAAPPTSPPARRAAGGGADPGEHPLHRQRPADDAGAAHQHLGGIGIAAVGRGRGHAQRVAEALGPVQALALPLLTTTARIGPRRRSVSWLITTGAALTRLRVKTPAAVHGRSLTMSAMSSRSPSPSPRMPAAAAAARKPAGAHTPARSGGAGGSRPWRHRRRPAVSGRPKRTFIACTPWPAAPLTRLSMATVTTIVSPWTVQLMAATLLPSTLLVGGGRSS